MNIFLSHINFMPFVYGAVLFLSCWLIFKNIISGQLFRAIGVVSVLYVGFQMHGHQAETRMAVAICALLVDICWPFIFANQKA